MGSRRLDAVERAGRRDRSWRATAGSFVAMTLASAADAWHAVGQDVPKFELVMKIVVTCSSPERVAPNTASPNSASPSSASKDGTREVIWPIIGGRFAGAFAGQGIQGTVIPGGGDFPVIRPDGVLVIDALYRLRTDDGATIIIHNKGLAYPAAKIEDWRYRLVPEFTAPRGRYEWLNANVFVSTLVVPVPAELALAKGPNENDRVIEVYRVY